MTKTIKETLASHEAKLDSIKETVEKIDEKLNKFDERIRNNEKNIYGIKVVGALGTFLSGIGIAIWRIFKG